MGIFYHPNAKYILFIRDTEIIVHGGYREGNKYSATCDLENLKSDLAAFLSQCESAIMSIMNKDYQSFISLALRLNGLKEKMENIRSPLVDNKDRLQQHKEDLIKECEVLTNLLKRYQVIEAKKQYLTQFLRIHTIITQSETIYNSVCFFSKLVDM